MACAARLMALSPRSAYCGGLALAALEVHAGYVFKTVGDAFHERRPEAKGGAAPNRGLPQALAPFPQPLAGAGQGQGQSPVTLDGRWLPSSPMGEGQGEGSAMGPCGTAASGAPASRRPLACTTTALDCRSTQACGTAALGCDRAPARLASR